MSQNQKAMMNLGYLVKFTIKYEIQTYTESQWRCVAEVCGVLSEGAAAVFGPMSPSSVHLRSLCATVQLPHVEARSDESDPSWSSFPNYTINVFPERAALNRALVDFIQSHQWTSVALLYINDDGKLDRKTLRQFTKFTLFYVHK